jgi:hypothetical protein
VTSHDDLVRLYRLWRHLPRVFRRIEFVPGYYGQERRSTTCAAADATVITSQVVDSQMHAPVLDIDMPCVLIPSSTPGHYHLLIERVMTWRQYKRLLRAMQRAGILETGFVRASLARGYTSVRVPWVKKST